MTWQMKALLTGIVVIAINAVLVVVAVSTDGWHWLGMGIGAAIVWITWVRWWRRETP